MHTKRIWNKALALLLAVVLSFTMIMPSAFAADDTVTEDMETEVVTEAVDDSEDSQETEDSEEEPEIEYDIAEPEYDAANDIMTLSLTGDVMTLDSTVYPNDNVALTSFTYVNEKDGGITAPLDSNDNAGNDSSDSNDIVRSFDYAWFTYEIAVSPVGGASAEGATVYYEASIDLSPEEAEFSLTYMSWLQDPVVTYTMADGSTSTDYSDASQVVKQALTGYNSYEGSQSMVMTADFYVYTKNMTNGSTFSPSVSAWVSSSDVKTAEANTVKVSSAEKYSIDVLWSDDHTFKNYDMNSGTSSDKSYQKTHNSTVYGLGTNVDFTISAKNDTDEKKYVGLYFNTDEITFNLDFSGNVRNSNGDVVGTLDSYQDGLFFPVIWDYYANGNVNTDGTGGWGRTLSDGTYDASNVPGGKLGNSGDNADRNCYNSGNWSVKQTGDGSYTVTIKDIDIDWTNMKFPTYTGNGAPYCSDGTYPISTGVMEIINTCPTDTSVIYNSELALRSSSMTVGGHSPASCNYGEATRTLTLIPKGSLVMQNLWAEISDDWRSSSWLSEIRVDDASGFAGTTYRACTNLAVSGSVAPNTQVVFQKWDASVFSVDTSSPWFSTGGLVGSYSNSDNNTPHTTYWAGLSANFGTSAGKHTAVTPPDSRYTAIDYDMSNTTMWSSDYVWYTDYNRLISDGYTCVGALYVVDHSNSTNSNAFALDLKVSDNAKVGETYQFMSEGLYTDYNVAGSFMKDNGNGTYSMNYGTAEFGYSGTYTGGGTNGYMDYWGNADYVNAQAGTYYSGDNQERTYIKPEYDSNGNQKEGTAVNAWYGGAALLIIGERSTISINPADGKDVYDLDNDEYTADMVLQPTITCSDGTHTTNAVVTVTIPADLEYNGDATWNGSAITPSDTKTNGDGSLTLTFTLDGVTAGATIAPILFSVTIPYTASNGQTFAFEATINSDNDNSYKSVENGNIYGSSIMTSQLAALNFKKYVDNEEIEQADASYSDGVSMSPKDITYTLRLTNSSDYMQDSTRIYDILPYNGDDLGSVIHGGYTVDSIAINWEGAPTSYAEDASSVAVYAESNGSAWHSENVTPTVSGDVVTYNISDLKYDAKADGENPIGIDIEIGNFEGREYIEIEIHITPYGNQSAIADLNPADKSDPVYLTDSHGNIAKNAQGEDIVRFYRDENGDVIYESGEPDKYFNIFHEQGEELGSAEGIVETTSNRVGTEVIPNAADISITKTVDEYWKNVNDEVVYTLDVTETIPGSTDREVLISDELPDLLDNYKIISVTGNDGLEVDSAEVSAIIEDGVLTAYMPELAYGEHVYITFSASVKVEAMGEYIDNIAVVTDVYGNEDDDNADIEVPTPVLSITKTANTDKYSVLDVVEYYIVVEQTTPHAIAFNTIITDTLPDELDLKYAVATDYYGNTLTVDYDGENGFSVSSYEDGTPIDLAYNEPITIQVVSIAMVAGEGIINTAVADADYIPPVEDDVPIDSYEAVLTIDKESDATRYYPDDIVTYSITVGNVAPYTVAYNAVISDALPEGLELLDVQYESGLEPTSVLDQDPVQGPDAEPPVVTEADPDAEPDLDDGSHTIRHEAIEIDYETNSFNVWYHEFAYGETSTITVTAKASEEYANTTQINTATFTADNGQPVEDTATIDIIQPLLSIEKTSDKEVYSRGEDVVFTIDITSLQDGVPAYDVVLNDTMPEGVTLKGVEVDGATADVYYITDDTELPDFWADPGYENPIYDTDSTADKDTEPGIESEPADIAEEEIDWADLLEQEINYALNIVDSGVLSGDDAVTLQDCIDLTLTTIFGDEMPEEEITDYDIIGALRTMVDLIESFGIQGTPDGMDIDFGDEDTEEHNWTVTMSISEDRTEATAVFTCADCGEVVEMDCTLTSAENEEGGMTYTASVVFEGAVYKDSFVFDADGEFLYATGIEIAPYDENDRRTVTGVPDDGTHEVTYTPSEEDVSDSFVVYFPYLNPGQTATVTVLATADEAGEFVNLATLEAPHTPPVEDDTTIEVLQPELSIVKTVNQEVCDVNDTVTWTINVTETVEDAVAYNVYVSDAMPDGLTIVGTPTVSGVDGDVEVSGQDIYVTADSLAYGDVLTVEVQTSVGEELVGKSVVNTAFTGADFVDEISDNATINVNEPVVVSSSEPNPTGSEPTKSEGPKTGEIIAFWSVVAAAVAAAVVAAVTVIRRKRADG